MEKGDPVQVKEGHREEWRGGGARSHEKRNRTGSREVITEEEQRDVS